MKNVSRKKLLGVILISLSIYSLAGIVFYELVPSPLQILNVKIPEQNTKGKPLPVKIELKVSSFTLSIEKITLTFFKKENEFYFSYTLDIQEKLKLGLNQLVIKVPPIIETNTKVIAFSLGEYVLTQLTVNSKEIHTTSIKIIKQFIIIPAKTEERIKYFDFSKEETLKKWQIKKSSEIHTEYLKDVGLKISNPTTKALNVSFGIETNLTGVPKIIIDYSFSPFNVFCFFNNSMLTVIKNSTTNSIFLASSVLGLAKLEVVLTLEKSTSIVLKTIRAPTRYVPVFTAILQYRWNEENDFDPLIDDFKEASLRFLKAYNISFIPGPAKPFTHQNTTDLFTIKQDALDQVEEIYGLSHSWITARPFEEQNDGFDLLFVATNHYADHFGIVFSENYEPLNIVVVASQSKEAYGITLIKEWVDNLFQHELSHVFWALDRWSAQDPPSIMTKPSSVQDAIAMYFSHQLWLQVTNWLIKDQIRIVQYMENF